MSVTDYSDFRCQTVLVMWMIDDPHNNVLVKPIETLCSVDALWAYGPPLYQILNRSL